MTITDDREMFVPRGDMCERGVSVSYEDVSPPYEPNCPDCGHRFSLADLKEMAIGDGWERYIAIFADGERHSVVSFSELNTLEPFWQTRLQQRARDRSEINLTRRTPVARDAYLQGYSAGIKACISRLQGLGELHERK